MSDDEFLSDDDYVPVPLKEVARHELHPIGTAARIAELEEWQRRRTKITGQVIDETVQLDARIRELEAGLRLYGSHHTPCPKSPHHDGYDFNQRCTCGLDDLIAANRRGKP
jgi:hypothetical protein